MDDAILNIWKPFMFITIIVLSVVVCILIAHIQNIKKDIVNINKWSGSFDYSNEKWSQNSSRITDSLDHNTKKWAETTKDAITISAKPADVKKNFEVMNNFMNDMGEYLRAENQKESLILKLFEEFQELKKAIKKRK